MSPHIKTYYLYDRLLQNQYSKLMLLVIGIGAVFVYFCAIKFGYVTRVTTFRKSVVHSVYHTRNMSICKISYFTILFEGNTLSLLFVSAAVLSFTFECANNLVGSGS